MKILRWPSAGLLLCVLAATTAVAKPWWARSAPGADADFLPPDVAFRVGAEARDDVIRVRWVIAPGYYLYRDKIQILAESPDLTVAAPELPPGTPVSDEFFGVQRIFTDEIVATAHYTRVDFGAHPLEVKVVYQGCAKAGLCYPPITKVLSVQAVRTVEAQGSLQSVGPQPWEVAAILGGGGAFLLAGLWLRKGRRLQTPGP